jgi:hypothetical protein
VKWRVSHLIIAGLLTVHDGIVTFYHGKAIWIAWAGDFRSRGLLVFFAALEASSLASAWVQGGSGFRILSESQNARPMRNLMPITAEARGQSDV